MKKESIVDIELIEKLTEEIEKTIKIFTEKSEKIYQEWSEYE